MEFTPQLVVTLCVNAATIGSVLAGLRWAVKALESSNKSLLDNMKELFKRMRALELKAEPISALQHEQERAQEARAGLSVRVSQAEGRIERTEALCEERHGPKAATAGG